MQTAKVIALKIILLFALSGMSWSSASLETEADRETLVLGHRLLPGSPYHYRILKMIKALELQTGINIELRRLPGKTSLAQSREGRIDGELSRIRGLSKKDQSGELFIVDAPWTEASFYVYAKEHSQYNISGWKSLQNLRYCHKRGTLIAEYNIEMYSLDAYPLNETLQLLKHLVMGRCQVTTLWQEMLTTEEQEFIDKHRIRPVYKLATEEGFIFLNKDRAYLKPTLEAALESIDNAGVRDHIFQLPWPEPET